MEVSLDGGRTWVSRTQTPGRAHPAPDARLSEARRRVDIALAELEEEWTEQRNQDAREGGDITYANGVLRGLAEARQRLLGGD